MRKMQRNRRCHPLGNSQKQPKERRNDWSLPEIGAALSFFAFKTHYLPLEEAETSGSAFEICAVAKWAMRKNSSALARICRLKSTKLCMRKPAQATRPENCRD